jgi:hypothetical protein
MLRQLSLTLIAGALALSSLAVSRAAAADDNKCTIATKGDSPVVEACQQGGIKRAKRVMQDLKKAAKAKKMTKVDCDDCHKDAPNNDFALGKDARDRFAEMLKVVGWTAAAK